tara:strand:+ start:229 stop:462 length:234 start_codon:yes stop_codon:yes gene_type:complete
MKVTSVRYFETNRGLGYEAKTDKGSIWNDGCGGCTYFDADHPKYHNKDFTHLSEDDLEAKIDEFEGVKRDEEGAQIV